MDEQIPIRLYVVDDHLFFRRALLKPLQASPLIDLIGSASDGEAALQFCRAIEPPPEVLLLDLHMPQGDAFYTLGQLGMLSQPPHCLILTGDATPRLAIKALRAGAAGYMLKDNVTDESLIHSIAAVANGGVYLDPQILSALLDTQMQLRSWIAADAPDTLDVDERNLLRAVGLGFDNQQIALRLNIAAKTVSNRLSLLYRKIEVDSRIKAAFFALQHGIVSLEEVVTPSATVRDRE